MKISIFGLGYVGTVSAALLADRGHTVIGVDISATKVDLLNQGRSPVIEKDLDTIIARTVKTGSLRALTSAAEAVHNSELSLICVGTPSKPNSSLNLDYVAKVCEEIGRELRKKTDAHVVCIRSTMLPGSTETVVMPSLESGFGGALPDRVAVAVNPEFLREGSAVYDFLHPPKTVVGAADPESAEKVVSLYDGIEAPVIVTSIRNAEAAKYIDNIFHALKIAFANEVGTICKAAGVDSHAVMDIFCSDTKLNISPAYLKPGFAFGGSCLPKDLRAMLHKSKTLDLDVPLLSSIIPSNDAQIKRAVDLVTAQGKKKLAFLGLSFKPGTDDLRESPLVELIETCIGKGYDLRIFDKNVSLARLTGANKAYIEKEIPHISRLMVPAIEDAVDFGEILVVGHSQPDFITAIERGGGGKIVIDLVRAFADPPSGITYIGFNW